jgi:hypothetical protein
MIKSTKIVLLIVSLAIFLSCGVQVKAVLLNEIVTFNIDANHTVDDTNKVQGKLIKFTSRLLFYVDKSWWDSQTYTEQTDILTNLDNLSIEYENKIYPTLTSVFGIEWKNGIDGDEKITILFHQMKDNMGGYFRSADEQPKIQVTDSNEREMLYLPIAKIDNNQLKVLLGHELVHLITYNQKSRIFAQDEEVWLNEGRAEYASTLLGYDDVYVGSNLQRRVNAFLAKLNDSLTEWNDTESDYASINIFLHYLVDHYGVNILSDSLKSKYVGIESINYALKNNGAKEDFSQIFTNWTIAILINDCTINEKYCYLNVNLKKIKINPTLNFLPLSGNSSLTVTNIVKNWSGNWQKIIGGKGDLKLEFSGLTNSNFKIPYIVYDKDNKYLVNFLTLNESQEGEIIVPEFGIENTSLIIMPTLQTKTSGFDGFEYNYPYTFVVSVKEQITNNDDQSLIQKLLARIEYLKSEIAKILAQRDQGEIVPNTCLAININLYFGMQNNSQVACLQTFLKSQGQDIYPEALVTGNFGHLTLRAVVRFQEKYASEILAPYGLQSGNGYVGTKTRTKINQLLNK